MEQNNKPTISQKYGNLIQALVVVVVAILGAWGGATAKLSSVEKELNTKANETEVVDNRLNVALLHQIQQNSIDDIKDIKFCLEGIKKDISTIDKRLDVFIGTMDAVHNIKP